MSKENLAVPGRPSAGFFLASPYPGVGWARATYNPNTSISEKESEETHDWC